MKIKLLELRKSKLFTQKMVADAVEISVPCYSRYERGEREADYTMLTRFATFFDVSIDFLLGVESKNIFVPAMLPKTEIQQLFDKMNELQQIEIVSYAKGMLARGASSSGEQQQLYSKKLKA